MRVAYIAMHLLAIALAYLLPPTQPLLLEEQIEESDRNGNAIALRFVHSYLLRRCESRIA